MDVHAVGTRLAAVQVDRAIVNLFTAPLKTEVNLIMAARDDRSADTTLKVWHLPKGVSATGLQYLVLHEEAGIVFADASEGAGITLEEGESLWAAASADDAVGVSIYGIPAAISGA